jgi:ubiquinone/menaquinone biosynthesis C-methylase UbiE
MPNDREQVELLRIFISSPSDVADERALVAEVLDRVNRTDGQEQGVRFEAFDWKKDVVPKVGAAPQTVVDDQTPNYDVYLGILATRFGTATGQFGSGTEKEFADALSRYQADGKPWILFYFKSPSSAPATAKEGQQYVKVLRFKSKVEKLGIIGNYKTLRGTDEGFFERLEHDLRLFLHKYVGGKRVSAKPLPLLEEERTVIQPTSEEQENVQFLVDEGPTEVEHRAALVVKAQAQMFDVISPCYLLDENFYFLDWNSAFDELVAKQLGLSREDHAIEFVRKLYNCEEVMEHSKQTFGFGKENPIVDTEILQIKTDRYGMVHFRKIAAQLTDDNGSLLAWAVNLNIILAENNIELRRDIETVLKEKLNWTRYALSYDKLLLPFDDYHLLVDRVVGKLGDAKKCVDLGAGTGNGTLRLLETDPERVVWAVDLNEAMLRYLRSKIRHASQPGKDYRTRLVSVKYDILTLHTLREKGGFFDAAILINVLYAVSDPLACLRQANRLLKPGGVLALSTPHRETDVDRLFAQMRVVLERKRKFAELKGNYDDARAVHARMNDRIHRDSKEDIRRYLDQTGFDVVDWHDNEYVNSVVVVKAVKRA